MCPSYIWLKYAPQTFSLKCAPQNTKKLIRTTQVSFAAKEEAEMAEFSKTKKQGKGVEHTKICAVNIWDYSWIGKKKKKNY